MAYMKLEIKHLEIGYEEESEQTHACDYCGTYYGIEYLCSYKGRGKGLVICLGCRDELTRIDDELRKETTDQFELF